MEHVHFQKNNSIVKIAFQYWIQTLPRNNRILFCMGPFYRRPNKISKRFTVKHVETLQAFCLKVYKTVFNYYFRKKQFYKKILWLKNGKFIYVENMKAFNIQIN